MSVMRSGAERAGVMVGDIERTAAAGEAAGGEAPPPDTGVIARRDLDTCRTDPSRRRGSGRHTVVWTVEGQREKREDGGWERGRG